MGYCEWAYTDPLNTTYHDNEWGVPVHDDRQMFEHLTLENLQCGLSWLIVCASGTFSGSVSITSITIRWLLTATPMWNAS